MKKLLKLSVVLLSFLVLGWQTVPKSTPEKASLQIELHHFVGDSLLLLDSAVYQNALGQPFTVEKFKYYIGNIRLQKTDGTEHLAATYFLIDEAEGFSKKITLENVLPGIYQKLSFTLGVDSLHNCSGLQTGALDPINAMFWAWNTGYVFLKLEGYAQASKSPGHFYEFHIGGFRAPNNCIRTISLPIENGLAVRPDENNVLGIKTDLAEVLKKPTTIDFGKMSAVTDFHNATTIADNYADMFQIQPQQR